VIDTGPLNALCHPKSDQATADWVTHQFDTVPGFVLIVPEVVDYELRRGYLRGAHYNKDPQDRAKAEQSLQTLELLLTRFELAPVTTSIWHRAAKLWADVRGIHQATAPDPALDADVLVVSCTLERGATLLAGDGDFKRFDVPLVEIPR
jgi:predicted nucleic acid-binding protein